MSSREVSRDDGRIRRLLGARVGVSALLFEQLVFARTQSEHGRNGSHWDVEQTAYDMGYERWTNS